MAVALNYLLVDDAAPAAVITLNRPDQLNALSTGLMRELTTELAQLNQLESCGGYPYLSSLIEHALPENLAAYVRMVREASQKRKLDRLSERLQARRKGGRDLQSR